LDVTGQVVFQGLEVDVGSKGRLLIASLPVNNCCSARHPPCTGRSIEGSKV
jgi:hypothetical protein